MNQAKEIMALDPGMKEVIEVVVEEEAVLEIMMVKMKKISRRVQNLAVVVVVGEEGEEEVDQLTADLMKMIMENLEAKRMKTKVSWNRLLKYFTEFDYIRSETLCLYVVYILFVYFRLICNSGDYSVL